MDVQDIVHVKYLHENFIFWSKLGDEKYRITFDHVTDIHRGGNFVQSDLFKYFVPFTRTSPKVHLPLAKKWLV